MVVTSRQASDDESADGVGRLNAAVAAGRARGKEDGCSRISADTRALLHPVHGGRSGTGWQVGDSMFVTDLNPVLRPDDDIGFARSLTLSEPGAPHRPRAGLRGNDHLDGGAMTRPACDPAPGSRGSGMLSGAADGPAAVVRLSTGTRTYERPVPTPETDPISTDGGVERPPDRLPSGPDGGPAREVSAIAFDPDGASLVVANGPTVASL